MKKHLFGIFSLLIIALASGVSVNAMPIMPAKAVNETRQPLVIIRFTKPDINYEDKLFSIARKALEIKNTVVFDVIARVPRNRTNSNKNQVVADSLADFGINPGQIKLGSVNDGRLTWEEVHVYVK